MNGVRAATRNGFLDWLAHDQPDVACLQETKASEDVLAEDIVKPPGYTSVWRPAEKKGYSGVAAFFRDGAEPRGVSEFGIGEFDSEGRVQLLDYSSFVLVNAYFPNSQAEGARLDYKLRFCNAILDYCDAIVKKGGHVLVCGDFNIAHREIDLARPKQNTKNPGFLPEERAFMDTFTQAGYVDTFRHFCAEPHHYTWWSYRAQARQKNVGWRIDYHCINEGFLDAVAEAGIQSHVMGSDHCPVELRLDGVR